MSRKHCFAASGVLAVALGGLVFTTSPSMAAPEVAKEVSTAALHAGLAATSQDMQATQMHLHHVVNCLAGTADSNFDATAGNPCNDQGNGAIPDTADPAKKAQLDGAMQEALAGLKETDLATAHKHAKAAQDVLKPAP